MRALLLITALLTYSAQAAPVPDYVIEDECDDRPFLYEDDSENADHLENHLRADQNTPAPPVCAKPPQPAPQARTTTPRLVPEWMPPPDEGRLNRKQLDHVASTCQSKIDQLWESRRQVPQDHQSAFQKSMVRAQEACQKICKAQQMMEKAEEEVRQFDNHMITAQQQYN